MSDPYCLQRQTQAKHHLLRHYLARWARVLSHAGHSQLMYIDGFSFAGKYTSDEDGGLGGPGSPLIALQCFTGEQAPTAQGVFLFVDKEQKYIEELEQNIEDWPHKPANPIIRCRDGSFSDRIVPALEWLEGKAATRHRIGSPEWTRAVVPTFVFIDPYGVTGFPMDLVGRILRLPRAETFINLMWVRTAWNLHNTANQNADVFTQVFGSQAWRDLLDLQGEELRRAFLDLYMARLRANDGAGARIVRSFEMCGSDGAVVYWMVFCTNHERGWEKMKEAMWQVDPGGQFRYRDTTARNQAVMFQAQPPFGQLRGLLLEQFSGREGVSISEIQRFVVVETPFLRTHVKTKVLRPLEKEGLIQVHRPEGKRKGTFVEGTTIDFP